MPGVIGQQRGIRRPERKNQFCEYDNFPSSTAKAAVEHRNYKQQNKLFLRFLLDRPCFDCMNKYPVAAMEFDHVRGVKKTCVSSLSSARGKMIEEINKCQIVCANCHRIRTANRDITRQSGGANG
jgi:hypothetical protein